MMKGPRGPANPVLVTVLVASLASGCSSPAQPAAEDRTHGTTSASAPVNPRRTPGELLLEVVAAAAKPQSMRIRGKVAIKTAVLLRLEGAIDPDDGGVSKWLDVGRRSPAGPLVSSTLVAEDDLFLRRPDLATRPGRPWLHVPGGDYPAGVYDDWAALDDLTEPARHLRALAEHGTGLSRTEVHFDFTRHTLVRGRLAGAGLPDGICQGAGDDRLRPSEVRFSVWVDGIEEVSKLVLECRYDDLPTVTWTGRYSEVGSLVLTLRPPPARRVTEPSGSGPQAA